MGPHFSTEKVHAHKAYDNGDLVDAQKNFHDETSDQQATMLLMNLSELGNFIDVDSLDLQGLQNLETHTISSDGQTAVGRHYGDTTVYHPDYTGPSSASVYHPDYTGPSSASVYHPDYTGYTGSSAYVGLPDQDIHTHSTDGQTHVVRHYGAPEVYHPATYGSSAFVHLPDQDVHTHSTDGQTAVVRHYGAPEVYHPTSVGSSHFVGLQNLDTVVSSSVGTPAVTSTVQSDGSSSVVRHTPAIISHPVSTTYISHPAVSSQTIYHPAAATTHVIAPATTTSTTRTTTSQVVQPVVNKVTTTSIHPVVHSVFSHTLTSPVTSSGVFY